jgi:endoglucanase
MPPNRAKRLLAAAAVTAMASLAAVSASVPAHADVDPSPVRVNQIGYLTGADKVATVVNPSGSPLAWQLRNAQSGATVATGNTTVLGNDSASGDHLHRATFTSYTGKGTFTLAVSGAGQSVPFTISDTALYPDLPREAMQYFYFHRMGTPVQGQYLQSPAHARDALHPGDESVPCYNSWCGSQRLNVRYSWADAGDFGIYPVNHAISAWTLLNLYERYPDAFPDGSLRIPENANGRPDILDEVEFGSRYMAGLLPSSGLASHKVHNHLWSGFPTTVGAENALARSAMPPSTNATYAVARTNAQLARTYAPFDAARAAALWASAKTAWARADAQPNVDYPNGTDAEGGGDYGDAGNDDDRYAAAAEMYLTALKRADTAASGYRSAVTGSPRYREISSFGWGEVAATGTLSLLSVANDLPAGDLATMRANVRAYADTVLAQQNASGYPAPMSQYYWGSNSLATNNMMVLAVAYDLSDDTKYLRAVNRAMDYFMGNNAMRMSFVTGYGEYSETDTHDRLAWAAYPGTPYPKGWLSGGPLTEDSGDTATPKSGPVAKRYAAKNTAPDAWGSKENTINWNAPLAWVATYANRTAGDLVDGGDIVPPTPPGGLTVTGTTASSASLSWNAATDNVGVVGYRVYRDGMLRGSVPGLTYTDAGLTAATTYSYSVRAYDAAGLESGPSGPVTATTQSGGGTGAVRVEYRNTDSSATDNQIRPQLRIANPGTSALALTGVSARYYFTRDGSQNITVTCDWAQVGCTNISTRVVALTTPVTGADAYLEITFTGGSVAAGQNSGDIQLRLNKSDWSNFNEADDYSRATNTAYADATRIPGYIGGTLSWGTPPA